MTYSTLNRPPQQKPGEQRETGRSVATIFTLARWQLKPTWRLLFVAEIGILAAVVLICLIPLYSTVALSAGLRDTLGASTANAYITETGESTLYQRIFLQQFQQTISQKIAKALAGYVQSTPIFSANLAPLTIAQLPGQRTELDPTGFPEQQIPQHVHLIEGHLPTSTGSTLEFVTTPAGLKTLEALQLGYKLGSVFKYPITLNQGFFAPQTISLTLKDVGVITLNSVTDTLWHGQDFQTITGAGSTSVPVLISNEALGNILEPVEASSPGARLGEPITVNWYYPLDRNQFDVTHLGDIASSMNQLLDTFNLAGNPLSLPPYVQQTVMLGPAQIFQYYNDRVTLLHVPIGTLMLLIGALILFFVSVIAGLLIEQQSEQIAFLRSRGATRGQLVGTLTAQSGLLALPILILGPILAWGLTFWLASLTLQGNDRAAVNVLLGQPIASILSMGWIALVVVAVALLVMAFTLFQKLRSNVLTSRQEITRNSRSPLWERWRLDLIGSAAALVGAGFAFYLANSGILNAHTRALILPIILLGTFLGILIAIVLLLFRFLPILLRWISQLASRRRGATAMLAIAQMARNPLQAARMTLLLAFTLAFSIFALTFNSTQAQRITDSAGFQVGSDFSGILSGPASSASWQQTEQAYAQIPGVLSATIGHAGIMENSNATIDIQAVDAGTCAQAMAWSTPDSTQEVTPLLQQLVARRQSGLNASLVPAIIDAAAEQSMALSAGDQFSLRDDNGSVNFITIGVVQHIPGILDDGVNAGTSDSTVTGGVLADYETFASVENASNSLEDEAESMWLKTSDNPTIIAGVRQELNYGQAQLNAISDRRAIAANEAYDPLEAAVENSLLVGAGVALLLGMIGSLFSSWINARKRALNFAMMRALGNTPVQITQTILWEQAIIYSLALVLGIGGGLLFAQIVAPGLLYTPVADIGITQSLSGSAGLNLAGTGELYLAQVTPAARAAIPLIPVLITIGIVVVIGMLALTIIGRLIARSSLSEVLRLNED